MARVAVAAGTTTMVATPHVDHVHGVDPESVAAAVDEIRSLLAQESVPLAVEPGGEIALTRLPELTDAQLDAITLGGGGYLLVECPFSPVAALLESVVLGIVARRRGVVLAHPERSPAFLGDRGRLAELVRRGARVQVTAASLTGQFGRRVQRFTLELLQHRLVHVVASDAHGASGRPPMNAGLFDSADRLLPGIADGREWWTLTAPAAILAGDDPGGPPAVGIPARSLRRFLPRPRTG